MAAPSNVPSSARSHRLLAVIGGCMVCAAGALLLGLWLPLVHAMPPVVQAFAAAAVLLVLWLSSVPITYLLYRYVAIMTSV